MVESSFKQHGIRESNTLESEIDLYAEEVSINGYTIVENILSDSVLEETRCRVDTIYEQQAAEIGGGECLRSINDEFVARCLLAYDEFFLSLATADKLISILKKLLGGYFILSQQNAIINAPGAEHYQGAWHRDLSYQHFVASRAVAVSALFCIDEFSAATGGTWVLAASHKVEKFPSREFVQRNETVINAKAGSVIVFDSMLFHRGGTNNSTAVRRAVNHVYSLPFIKQQISLPQVLRGRHREDAFLNRLLGYESEAAPSVHHWRSQRLQRLP
jgi:ectoine hydroxylase-related dioxygenase (phytanoyl-CoA dioxygenase family)